MPVDFSLPTSARNLDPSGFSTFDISSLIDIDLTARAEAFPPIIHIWRRPGDDAGDESNARPFTNNSLEWFGTRNYIVVATTTTIVPEVLPGSDNREIQDDSIPLTQGKLGSLNCFSFGSNCVVDFAVRRVTSSIPTGSSTLPTYTNWTTSRSIHSGSSNQKWVAAQQIITPPITIGLTLPLGTSSGDLIELLVAFRQGSASVAPAWLSGVIVEWGKLTTLAPNV